jgi:hypothetical protein
MKKLGWKDVILMVVDRRDVEDVLLYTTTTRRKVFKHKKKFWVEIGGWVKQVERGPDGIFTELAQIDPALLSFDADRRVEQLTAALCERNEAIFLRLMREPVRAAAMKAYLEKRGWFQVAFVEHPELYMFENEAYLRRQLNFPRVDSEASDFQEVMTLIIDKLAELERREGLLVRNDLYALRRVL